MATNVLSADNSIYVQITLSNPITDAFINDATVTGKIDREDGTEAVPSFPIPYVAASDGIYRTTLAPDVDIQNGLSYRVIIDALGADLLVGHWECIQKATKSSGCA